MVSAARFDWRSRGPSRKNRGAFRCWARSRVANEDISKAFNVDQELWKNDVDREAFLEDLKGVLAEEVNVVHVDCLYGDWLAYLNDAKCSFATLRIRPPPTKSAIEAKCVISGLNIHELEAIALQQLVIEDCQIGRLTLGHGESQIEVRNSAIEYLDIQNVSLKSLHWDGGFLGWAKLPLHDMIRGDLSVRNVALSRDREPHGIQWLRDVRAALITKNNLQAASVFHAAELTLNRAFDPPDAKIVSWIYEKVSNYGNSIGRPAGWLSISLLSAFLVSFFGGTILGAEPLGWYADIRGTNVEDQALRAVIYSFGAVFNPLNLLVSKPMVAAVCWPIALVAAIIGLFGTLSFGLLLLSIRRRFKIE